MKSFQVVIVTILFMALLMTSDAGKGGRCKNQLNKVRKELEQCETKLKEAEQLVEQLQNKTGECQNYQTLSDGDRKNMYTSTTTVAGNIGCDHNLGPAWFRFQGDAGTKMATSCVQPNRCGTHSTGWLNGAHPTVNEGQVTRQACFSWSGNCCTWSIDIKVRNCGDFYVYYINKTPPEHMCHLRYCGSD